jgi:hypothetical protein
MNRQSFNSKVAIVLFLLSPLFTNTPVHAAVVMNELLPKTEPATGEWVELYNTGSSPVSLDRWKIQNTTGFVQTFILNAGAIIPPRGFLTFNGSQTGISFSIQGDTVRLFDENNTEVDRQSYPSILGYNTSMGRSSDGDGPWVLCTTPTYNLPNNCPQPSPTPTPIPTSTPTPTPKPMATAIPTPPIVVNQPLADTSNRQTFGSFLPSPTGQALGATNTISPTPTAEADILQFAVSKSRIAYILLGIAAVALLTMLTLWLHGRLRSS